MKKWIVILLCLLMLVPMTTAAAQENDALLGESAVMRLREMGWLDTVEEMLSGFAGWRSPSAANGTLSFYAMAYDLLAIREDEQQVEVWAGVYSARFAADGVWHLEDFRPLSTPVYLCFSRQPETLLLTTLRAPESGDMYDAQVRNDFGWLGEDGMAAAYAARSRAQSFITLLKEQAALYAAGGQTQENVITKSLVTDKESIRYARIPLSQSCAWPGWEGVWLTDQYRFNLEITDDTYTLHCYTIDGKLLYISVYEVNLGDQRVYLNGFDITDSIAKWL